jgi:Toprim domain
VSLLHTARSRVKSDVDWEWIDRITQGRLGRTMATCPVCSDTRRTTLKRKSKVLAVTLREPDFAVYYCNHCELSGYAHSDRPGRHRVIDFVEIKRRQAEAAHHAEVNRRERTENALRLWEQGTTWHSSPAWSYLYYSRGLATWLDTFPYLDQVFRFHPDCPFGDARHPCLLSLVRDIKTDDPIAVHRTALTPGDRPQRIDRKSLGPVSGGAIKLSPQFDVHEGLLVGEGVETTLSASAIHKFKPAWSLIDANGIAKFPALPGVECLTIAVDNDQAGEDAARKCVARLTDAGVECITTKTTRVKDFNDLLMRAQR